MVNGYNIALKIGGKTIVGRTQDDLTIAATVKESIDKDDAGTKRFSVTGHEVTFKVSAMMSVDAVGSGVQKVNRNFLIEQALISLLYSYYLFTVGDRASYHSPDGCVHSRRIAAARKYRNCFNLFCHDIALRLI